MTRYHFSIYIIDLVYKDFYPYYSSYTIPLHIITSTILSSFGSELLLNDTTQTNTYLFDTWVKHEVADILE
jgi:hypothetical protein